MGKEFELKYAASEAVLDQIAGQLGDFTPIAMETTYFDTPGRDFSARKMTLRRRLENGRSVCTLKAPAGPNCRREWEVEAQGLPEAIPELCKLSGWPELAALAEAGLQPICGAKFLRRAKLLVLPECTVELALDTGVLAAEEKQLPLWELEVELKAGSEAAAERFARALAAQYGLVPQPKSKFARAAALAAGL